MAKKETVLQIYGIPNCDTIKKTLKYFEQNNAPFVFHNYKTEGISKSKLSEWCKKVGWEILLNKKSTTWRGLSSAQQNEITTQAAAINLMMENNSIIKRPVIEYEEKILVGFNENAIEQLQL